MRAPSQARGGRGEKGGCLLFCYFLVSRLCFIFFCSLRFFVTILHIFLFNNEATIGKRQLVRGVQEEEVGGVTVARGLSVCASERAKYNAVCVCRHRKSERILNGKQERERERGADMGRGRRENEGKGGGAERKEEELGKGRRNREKGV